MKRPLVISYRYLPQKLPLTHTLVMFLWLDHVQASQIARGIMIGWLIGVWLVAVAVFVVEKQVSPGEVING